MAVAVAVFMVAAVEGASTAVVLAAEAISVVAGRCEAVEGSAVDSVEARLLEHDRSVVPVRDPDHSEARGPSAGIARSVAAHFHDRRVLAASAPQAAEPLAMLLVPLTRSLMAAGTDSVAAAPAPWDATSPVHRARSITAMAHGTPSVRAVRPA